MLDLVARILASATDAVLSLLVFGHKPRLRRGLAAMSILSHLFSLWGSRREAISSEVAQRDCESRHDLGEKKSDLTLLRTEEFVSALSQHREAPSMATIASHPFEDDAAAEQRLRDALVLDFENPQLQAQLAGLLRRRNKLKEAEAYYRSALKLLGNAPDVRFALAELLTELSRSDEADMMLSEILCREPHSAEDNFWKGFAAFRRLDFETAFRCLLLAKTYDFADRRLFLFLAMSALFLRFFDQPERILQEGLQRYPDDEELEFALGIVNLSLGCLGSGFILYEHRDSILAGQATTEAQQNWQSLIDSLRKGIPACQPGGFRGKRILVIGEQGFGDIIMMLRFLSIMLERGASQVVLLCPSLLPLRHALPGIEFVGPHNQMDITQWGFDCQCRVMSLPYVLEVHEGPIPGKVPYLFVPPAKLHQWRVKVDSTDRSGELRVGIVWAGGHQQPFDAIRSIELASFAPICSVPGVKFYSLQKEGGDRGELAVANAQLVDLMGECEDFLDTAALVMNLDLVISVDTAVAHLTGALGKPVWLLNRFESEWRWQFNREDSPWYPSMRIFNQQEPRSWAPVIAAVRDALVDFAEGDGQARLSRP